MFALMNAGIKDVFVIPTPQIHQDLKKFLVRDTSLPDLRTVNNHIIGNISFYKKIILKNIKNHLFLV